MLAADKALSTLPVAVQMTGTMLATVPAALLMARIGRRGGFWTGAAIGVAGAVIATAAIFAAVLRAVLRRHVSDRRQYRLCPAIPLRRLGDRRRRVPLEGDFAGAGGRRRLRRCSGRRPRYGRATCSRRSLFAGCYAMIVVAVPGLGGLAVFRASAEAGGACVAQRRPAVRRDRRRSRSLSSPSLAGDGRLWGHVGGHDGDADRHARLRLRVRRRCLRHPVARARHVCAELFHRAI